MQPRANSTLSTKSHHPRASLRDGRLRLDFTPRPYHRTSGRANTQSDLAASLVQSRTFGRLYPATKPSAKRRDALEFPLKNRPAGRIGQLRLMDAPVRLRVGPTKPLGAPDFMGKLTIRE